MIYIASDHGGFELKNKILDWAKKNNLDMQDYGPKDYDLKDDYPVYVIPMVKKIQSDQSHKGILICRNGIGVCMLANKYKGIRAGLSWTPEHAKSGRNDDNTNVLALPADYIDADKALEIIDAWINTPFSNADRFIRRLSYDNTGN